MRYLTVAEVLLIQHQVINRYGGLHGVGDMNAIEAAVFRPQIGYHGAIEDEAAALMESLANNHGFLDGNKRIAFAVTDTFLRINGFYLDVISREAHRFIVGSMEQKEFRYPQIRDWIRSHIRPRT
jgi:death-on-curing protein